MRTFSKFIFTLSMLCFLNSCDEVSAKQPSEQTAETETKQEEEQTKITIDSSITLDYLRGHFDPAKREDFTAVEKNHTDGDGIYYLRKDAYAAFQEMHEAAASDGVQLTIISATRNFDRQKAIWEAKWTGARLLEGSKNATQVYPNPVDRATAILQWSSMPGTSRHHWGTDMDLNALNNKYFEKGEGLKVYEWMTTHATSFGFCQPYSPKGDERPHGYNEEKWHWSYLPVALQLTALAGNELSNEEISGFKGAETAPLIDVVNKYILGVNKACLD